MQVSSVPQRALNKRMSRRDNIDFQSAKIASAISALDFFKSNTEFRLPIQRVPKEQKELMSLTEKVVLVTGGSKGIGRAACERFVKAGCHVFGTSRTPEKVHDLPSNYELLKLDVRSDVSVKSCINEIIARHGHIDVLINNAGIGQYGRLIKAKPEHWNAVFETNLLGVHRVTTAAYPYMQRPGCRIITLGSLEGETGYPYQAIYAISKRALQMWNDSFDFEQRTDDGPRFSLIEPAWVNTGFGMSQDIVNTEPDGQDPYARIAQKLFPKFLKQYGIEPEEVGQAIFTIAAMPKPHVRYFIGAQGSLFMGYSLEDLLTIIYTQPPEAMLAFLDALSKITYHMYEE